MTRKAIFTVQDNGVLRRIVNLTLPGGFAVSQKRKGIQLVHECFMRNFKGNQPLEVSTKSELELGQALSAFNLKDENGYTVERLFQSSKKFRDGGPYTDILDMTSSKAKKDERLRNSGPLVSFVLNDTEYPLQPTTAFYDWLYINTLLKNKDLVNQLIESGYTDFTDIEFNPDKSLNCQAEAVALFLVILKDEELDTLLNDGISFEEIAKCLNN